MVLSLSNKLSLPSTKVYKWNWDRRRADKVNQEKFERLQQQAMRQQERKAQKPKKIQLVSS
jgi:hypothetical protein